MIRRWFAAVGLPSSNGFARRDRMANLLARWFPLCSCVLCHHHRFLFISYFFVFCCCTEVIEVRRNKQERRGGREQEEEREAWPPKKIAVDSSSVLLPTATWRSHFLFVYVFFYLNVAGYTWPGGHNELLNTKWLRIPQFTAKKSAPTTNNFDPVANPHRLNSTEKKKQNAFCFAHLPYWPSLTSHQQALTDPVPCGRGRNANWPISYLGTLFLLFPFTLGHPYHGHASFVFKEVLNLGLLPSVTVRLCFIWLYISNALQCLLRSSFMRIECLFIIFTLQDRVGDTVWSSNVTILVAFFTKKIILMQRGDEQSTCVALRLDESVIETMEGRRILYFKSSRT